MQTLVNDRQALYYMMTGETFKGQKAKELGLVNESVPADKLVERTRELAKVLLEKNPLVLRNTKLSHRYIQEMSWEQAGEYLMAKGDQTTFMDPEKGRHEGIKQFLDDMAYKPGLGAYSRD